MPRKVARKLQIAARLASRKATAGANATTHVKLRLAPKARTRLRRLSGSRLRKLRATVKVVATDATGVVVTLRWKVRLTR